MNGLCCTYLKGLNSIASRVARSAAPCLQRFRGQNLGLGANPCDVTGMGPVMSQTQNRQELEGGLEVGMDFQGKRTLIPIIQQGTPSPGAIK